MVGAHYLRQYWDLDLKCRYFGCTACCIHVEPTLCVKIGVLFYQTRGWFQRALYKSSFPNNLQRGLREMIRSWFQTAKVFHIFRVENCHLRISDFTPNRQWKTVKKWLNKRGSTLGARSECFHKTKVQRSSSHSSGESTQVFLNIFKWISVVVFNYSESFWAIDEFFLMVSFDLHASSRFEFLKRGHKEYSNTLARKIFRTLSGFGLFCGDTRCLVHNAISDISKIMI